MFLLFRIDSMGQCDEFLLYFSKKGDDFNLNHGAGDMHQKRVLTDFVFVLLVGRYLLGTLAKKWHIIYYTITTYANLGRVEALHSKVLQRKALMSDL